MQNNFTLEIYVTSKLEEKIISAENFGKLRLAGKKIWCENFDNAYLGAKYLCTDKFCKSCFGG